MKFIVAFLVVVTIVIGTPTTGSAAAVDAGKHYHYKHHGKKYSFFSLLSTSDFLAASLSKKHISTNSYPKASKTLSSAARRRATARARRASGLTPVAVRQAQPRCATIIKPTVIHTYFKEVPRTKVERILYGAGIITGLAMVAAVLALLTGFIIGWFRRGRNEDKFLDSVLRE